MAILSQTAEYGLRAVIHMAAHPERPIARVADLARELDIPSNYLSKTLSQLVRAGVLRSTRGRHGGFALARPADQLTLEDVVGRFENMGQRHCLLGNQVCTDRTPCVAHAAWRETAERMTTFFRSTTVADILDRDDATHPPVVPGSTR